MPLRNLLADHSCNPESIGRGISLMSAKTNSTRQFEPERYELSSGPSYRFDLGRREFFKFLGSGLVIVSALKPASAQESGSDRQRGGSLPQEINAWLHIGENGTVTVYTGKVEVGQNIRTSLTQAVSEELRVPSSRHTTWAHSAAAQRPP
jgi:isoquinoline 1-oxidoreductase